MAEDFTHRWGVLQHKPDNITVSLTATTLPAGTYTGEIILTEYSQENLWMVVPVTLSHHRFTYPCHHQSDRRYAPKALLSLNRSLRIWRRLCRTPRAIPSRVCW